MRSLAVSLALFFLLDLLVPVALAQAEQSETPAYSDAVALGVAEFEGRNFIEARAHFSRAHALFPNARTLRALGMVAFELKKYSESVHYLNNALASRERPLESDQREQAQALLARARNFLARFTLEVTPSAEVVLDGMPAFLEPGGVLILEAGDHVLELKAAGYITDRRKLEIHGGEQKTLRVALAALSGASSEQHDASGPEAKRPLYKNPWLWTALGVVVVGAAAGTAIALTHDGSSGSAAVYTGNGGAPALMGPRE
jgi:tetratricopeptide (TPR) repeat protein